MMTMQQWQSRSIELKDLSERATYFHDKAESEDRVAVSVPLSLEELKIVNDLCNKESRNWDTIGYLNGFTRG